MTHLLLALAFAQDGSYMDSFAEGQAPSKTPAPPVATSDVAEGVAVSAPPDAVKVARAEVPTESAPEPEVSRVVVTEVEPAGQLVELQATVAALQAQLAGMSTDTKPARVRRPPPEVGVTASLGVASAYMFRGANYFGTTSGNVGSLVAPSLEVGIGDVTVGWWSGYQATGIDRDAYVRNGSGHEQDLYLSYGRDLSERVHLSGAVTGYWYPFSVEEEAGADAALWVEPSAQVEVDLGLTLTGSAAWYQGAQSGIAPSSYGYFTAGAGHGVSVAKGATVDLGVLAGFKAPAQAEQWPDNTVDVTLSWGMTWETEGMAISPAGHLTWTNLADVDPASETLLWFGVDTAVKL